MKLIFTCGVFDLLHEGHLNLLLKMKHSGEINLVVLHDGFTTFHNKKKLPIENLEKRTRNLIDTGLVDIVKYTFEKEPVLAFEKVVDEYGHKFDLEFMRGDDWKDFPAKKALDHFKIPITYVPYTENVSSSKLRLAL